MRQKLRRTILLVSLLLFPVTLNFFSPYVSIDGAMAGVVSGSLLLFAVQALTAVFFGRAWCAWACPVGGLSEFVRAISDRPVKARPLAVVRYAIFAVWAAFVVLGFVMAGGVKGIDPLHLTERFVSVDEPLKYITYYLVLAVFVALSIAIGRRGACHAICWMSPFMTAGYSLGRWAGLPQLRVVSEPGRCTDCRTCDRNCPMSLPVGRLQASGAIRSSDCILCGECVDHCPRKVLRYGVRGREQVAPHGCGEPLAGLPPRNRAGYHGDDMDPWVAHPLPPIFDKESRVLVLGTMPSPRSRETGFYYGNPQNRFWAVLSAASGEAVPATREEKLAFLHRHRIALWDVLAACRIAGASDASIREPVANDVGRILASAPIRAVFATGETAGRLYDRLCLPTTGVPAARLPSTSPANRGRWPFEALVERYRAVLETGGG
jgi:ferredoxin-type protein NapH